MMSDLLNGRQPTPAATWKRPRLEGVVVPLPSGFEVRLRPIPLTEWVLGRGNMPSELTGLAAKTLYSNIDLDNVSDAVERAKEFVELLQFVAKETMLYPRVTEDGAGEDEITLSDIDPDDLIAIYNYATRYAAALRPFRLQQGADAAVVPDGGEDRAAA
ncbi:MAG: hypothetical protein IT328_04630 [Caldilineaceae bacterium]|nr:hypothetical protein [Caldilineaceae bacterium]